MQNLLITALSKTPKVRALQATFLSSLCLLAQGSPAAPAAAPKSAASACPGDDSGLTLPQGFCASVFADGIGHARHMAVSSAGVVYVNTWSGEYFGNDVPHEGGFLVALKDTSGKGKANQIERFGETVKSGGAGGTGIGIYKDWLYAESNDKIVRYRLDAGLSPKGAPETIVSGLPLGGDHPMHPFMIDPSGHLYVDVATATNSCQPENRSLESKGLKPCTELETRGGVWLYDANKANQKFSPAERYATGIRNAEGIAQDAKGNVYVTQHGRDQLHSNWPNLYTLEQEATLPAEELMQLKKGGDYGWPECYFDPKIKKLILAPEYGGDAKKSGECAQKSGPVAAFPAHWAPDGMAYYDKADKTAFPDSYRNGVYIAFHGSWNRAPYPQRGYLVVFQALTQNAGAGRCEIFADGFAGAERSPDKAEHRPTGIAVGPDGSMYVSDDVRGRIYRIHYQGGATGGAKPVPCPNANQAPGEIVVAPDKGDSAQGAAGDASTLPVAYGATREMVIAGDKLFHGQIAGASCTGCHGSSATGTPLAPNLTRDRWFWSDGTWAGIAATIRTGVPMPKNFRSPMPALGGTSLTADQVNSIAAYVWGLNHAHDAPALKSEVHIPGDRVFPESITSTADGRLIIGSIIDRAIYVVDPGSDTAKSWIKANAPSNLGVFGVFADDHTQLLWACWSEAPGVSGPKLPSVLVSYDLKSGTEKGRYPLPTSKAFCNDIATTPDGSVYVTDTFNMEIDWLAKGAGPLKNWAGGGFSFLGFGGSVFGKVNTVLDGISVVGDAIYVNVLSTGKLFVVPLKAGGEAGTPEEVKLDRPMVHPDGMRAFGKSSVLIVDSGSGVGRLSMISLKGASGKVTPIKEGFPGGPVSVAVLGQSGYVLEGQLEPLFDPKAKPATPPFKATAAPVGTPP